LTPWSARATACFSPNAERDDIRLITPMHVAAYIEQHPGSPQTIKQHLAAIKISRCSLITWWWARSFQWIRRPWSLPLLATRTLLESQIATQSVYCKRDKWMKIWLPPPLSSGGSAGQFAAEPWRILAVKWTALVRCPISLSLLVKLLRSRLKSRLLKLP